MGSCDYEAVSALVDGELDEQECDSVIQHLNACCECRRLFERFHDTRNLVRGEADVPVPGDLSERVCAAIADEAPAGPDNNVSSARPTRGGRFGWGWMAAAAGAAGVALAAGFLLNPAPRPGAPGESGSSPSLAQSAEPASEPRTQQAPDSEDMATIQRYLPEHSSFVPSDPRAEFQRTRLETDKRR